MRLVTTIILALAFGVALLVASVLLPGWLGAGQAPQYVTGTNGFVRPPEPGAFERVRAPTLLCYRVEGMHCGGCAEAIIAEVTELKGVTKVDCTFESGRASIQVNDPALTAEVERAITKLGYTIISVPAPADQAVTTPASSK